MGFDEIAVLVDGIRTMATFRPNTNCPEKLALEAF